LIESYLTDLIDIITDTYDSFGVVTNSIIQSNIKARWEDKNGMVKNMEGQEVVYSGFLIVDPKANLEYNSRVKLLKQNGVITLQSQKERMIIRLGKAHGFDNEYWRVWL
jgi:hypothetical protein